MADASYIPAAGGPSAESQTATGRGPTFSRVLLVLAATVVVLAGMRLASPILNPILFAVVLSLLFAPIYAWLRRRRVPTPVALVVKLVGLTALFAGLSLVMVASISNFTTGIGSYTDRLGEQVGAFDALIARLGLAEVDVREVVQPSVITGYIGAVLSGIAGFLSNIFLILMIVLFLLAEGPAIMDRFARARVRTTHRSSGSRTSARAWCASSGCAPSSTSSRPRASPSCCSCWGSTSP